MSRPRHAAPTPAGRRRSPRSASVGSRAVPGQTPTPTPTPTSRRQPSRPDLTGPPTAPIRPAAPAGAPPSTGAVGTRPTGAVATRPSGAVPVRASLTSSTMVMAGGTATSRLLGFVRGTMLAGVVGTAGFTADAFSVADRVPSFIYAILAGGLVNAVLVPQIVKAYAQGRGPDYVDRLVTVGASLLAGLTIALTAAAGAVMWLMTNGWNSDQRGLATAFAIYCLPQVFFYGLYALIGQVLNARGSFGPYMWAPALNNIVASAGFVAFILANPTDQGTIDNPGFWTPLRVGWLAGSSSAGIVCQALVLLFALRRIGIRLRPRWGWREAGLGAAARVAGWTLGAVGIDQAAFMVAYRLTTGARQAADGALVAANAAFDSALMIYIIPHSVITVSLTTALFTRMSAAAVDGNTAKVKSDFSYGVRVTSSFTVLATACLIVLALPISRAIFFLIPPAQVPLIATALVPLAIGLVPMGISLFIRRVFFAFEDGRTVFLLQIPMSLVFVAGTGAAVLWLEPRWWVAGACAAQTLSFVTGVVARIRSLRRRLGGIDGVRLVSTHARAIGAAGLAGLAGWWVVGIVPDGGAVGVGSALCAIVAGGLEMLAVYVVLLRLTGANELFDFMRPERDHRAKHAA